MKKIIVALVLLHLIGPPARADAVIADTVTSTSTVTFIANPNLPKPQAPGLPQEMAWKLSFQKEPYLRQEKVQTRSSLLGHLLFYSRLCFILSKKGQKSKTK